MKMASQFVVISSIYIVTSCKFTSFGTQYLYVAACNTNISRHNSINTQYTHQNTKESNETPQNWNQRNPSTIQRETQPPDPRAQT